MSGVVECSCISSAALASQLVVALISHWLQRGLPRGGGGGGGGEGAVVDW